MRVSKAQRDGLRGYASPRYAANGDVTIGAKVLVDMINDVADLERELTAARAVSAAIQAMTRTGLVCPLCGAFSASPMGGFEHADDCALGAYEAAVKGAA